MKNLNVKRIQSYLLISLLMVVVFSAYPHSVMADADHDAKKEHKSTAIGNNYYKKVDEEDVVIDNKAGIIYVKNQLLISALIGTDKTVVEKMVNEVGAKIVGYIELTNDYQIEFAEDKSLEELKLIADYIDSYSFVSTVTLNLVKEHREETPTNVQNSTVEDNKDDIDEWAKLEVEKALQNKLVPLALQSDYRQAIKRKDFAQLVVSCIEHSQAKSIDEILVAKTGKDVASIIQAEKFSDCNDKNVIAAKVLEVINGIGDNKFNPEGNITRQEAATLLERTAKYLGKDSNHSKHYFKDQEKISAWSQDSVDFVANLELMQGVGDNYFDPLGTYSREQAYITIYRLFEKIKEHH